MKFARLIAVGLLWLPTVTLAWDALGHRVTCDIAFQELNSTARAAVLELIRADPDFQTFADACTWPDQIPSDASYNWAKPYHFVNLPQGHDGVSLCRDCQPRGCALAGIYRYAGVLRDENAPLADRVMALKFLGHFVGDVHQPLHVSFAEDRGGNQIKVTFFGRESNLHSVWDTTMIARGNPDWRDLGRALHASITDAQRTTWSIADLVQWANESYAITIDPATRYVGAPTCCTGLGQAYPDANLPKVKARLRQGGYRLALVLNRIWPES